jgi:hypothetical protein
MCRTSARSTVAWHNLRGRGFAPKIPPCLVFAQHEIFLINQRSFLQSNRLRTILSTKDVQNVGRVDPAQIRPETNTAVRKVGPAPFLAQSALPKNGFIHEFTACLFF